MVTIRLNLSEVEHQAVRRLIERQALIEWDRRQRMAERRCQDQWWEAVFLTSYKARLAAIGARDAT